VQNGTAFIPGHNIAPDEDIMGTATPSAPSRTSECTATAIGQSSDGATAVELGVGSSSSQIDSESSGQLHDSAVYAA
jgi:hypothetical protein